jgi:mitochondrial fission protein ELM1
MTKLSLAPMLAITAGLISAILVWILPADFAGILVIGLFLPGICCLQCFPGDFGATKHAPS